MMGFTVRNLKVFFKDRAAVFFSLLAVFIIIGLYALFLGDVWMDDFEGMDGARTLMDSWIVAGLLTVASVTTTMGAFGIMVEDKQKKINKDFIASPVKNSSIVGGYILSAILVGIIMTLVTLFLSELYIVSNGGAWMTLPTLFKVLGLIVLATVANASLVLFLVSFFKSVNAFATASTIIGTLIGFLTGVYLPVGTLPETVQWVVKCFPPSHAGALLRRVMMEEPISVTFAHAPTEAVQDFRQSMGVEIWFGETAVGPFASILILLGTAALFFILSVWNLSRKQS